MITDAASNKVIPFWYLVPTASLGIGASATYTLTLGQDSKFEWHTLQAVTDKDDFTDPHSNNFSCLITDLSTGMQLMTGRIPQAILTGPNNGGFLRLVRPVQFNPGATIAFDCLNLNAAAVVITFVLGGYKLLL
jgi:hypothetical protein